MIKTHDRLATLGRLTLLACAAALAGSACRSSSPEVLDSLATSWPPECQSVTVAGIEVDTVARGLDVPWAMVELPDGRVLVSERGGRIRLLQDGSLRDEPWAVLEAASVASGEGGLLGLAWLPDASSPGVLAVRTVRQHRSLITRAVRRLPGVSSAWRPNYVNELLLLEDQGATAGRVTVLLTGLPSSIWTHAGGEVGVGPDGLVYLSLGDAAAPATAADPRQVNGSLLRMTATGGVPRDNPVPGSLVFASGLRNVQGLDWHPETHELFVTDHGPTGLEVELHRRGQDELNLIVPGGDYGWPTVAGRGGAPHFEDPVQVWHPVFAPARLRFMANRDSPWFASAFITTLRFPGLVRAELGADGTGWRVACQEVLLPSEAHGRLRALAILGDGSLLVGTSNRDGRGSPRPGDDLILRVRPAGQRFEAAPTSPPGSAGSP